VTGTNTTNTNGQGYGDGSPGTAANIGDTDYPGSKGYGATGNAAGQDGFIAIRY
jgi:hypothetical protein